MLVGLQARKFGLFWAVLLCTATGGCSSGESRVSVRGKVVDDNQPVAIANYEEGGACVQVDFILLDEGGNVASDPNAPTQSAFCKQDGSFEVQGMDGKGIRAGRYRVAVYLRGETPNGMGDVWQGKFDGDRSPFVVDVTGDDEVVIDVSKP